MIAAQQAAPPAFVPHRSPNPTPTAAYGGPVPFGSSGPPTPPQPAQPAPPPAPTGPPANVNIANVDTSKVRRCCHPRTLFCTLCYQDVLVAIDSEHVVEAVLHELLPLASGFLRALLHLPNDSSSSAAQCRQGEVAETTSLQCVPP